MWDGFLRVCTIVGMLAIYTLIIGSLLVWGLRTVKRRAAKHEGRLAAGAPMGIDRRARSWAELPEWVSQEREWATAIVILGSGTLCDRTAAHVDFSERRVNWDTLREAAREWDDDARALVVAADTLAHADMPRMGTLRSPGPAAPA